MTLRTLHYCLPLSFALLFFTSTTIAAWQRFEVNADLLITLFGEDAVVSDQDGRPGFIDGQGIERFPGCSEGPQPIIDEAGQLVGPFPPPTSPGEFSFFVETGDEEEFATDLLIYLAGGGVCWDAATCIGSALTPMPTYYSAVFETEGSLDAASADAILNRPGAGGILTIRSDNPYAGHAKVYIPYCTGDVHVGSRDTTYDFALPPELGGETLVRTIRHRGFDNLLVVLEWLQRAQDESEHYFENITVGGSSAGGYGTLINFPVLRQAIGEDPDYSIIVDSANGVLTNGFLDRAFGSPGVEGVWGVRQNVDELLQPILDLDVHLLWWYAFSAVGREYRDTRISQSTAAYDAVQAIVLLTMQKVDNGTYNPFVPPTDAEVAQTALLDWSPKARALMRKTALSVPNYRFYLGAGPGHIILLDPPLEIFPFPTTNYFDENSARGVYYTDWLDDMLNNPRLFFGTNWRNLSCFPGCLQ